MAIKHEKSTLFMVWTKKGRPPRFAHGSLEAATQEAERLAALHPDRKFLVLQAVDKISAAA